MNYYYEQLNTKVGTLHVVADETKLLILAYPKYWSYFKKRFPKLQKEHSPVIEQLKVELDEYLTGSRKKFSVPFELVGTPFQKQVWKALLAIPFGKTSSYQDQAKKLHKPSAVRAVANANGKNPISILVPCHRVIGKSGHLTGYAGGLPAKTFLLQREGALDE